MISIVQLRHPTTIAKIQHAWEEVIEVSELRKDRTVRYVLDRKGKEWIRMEKSPGQPVIVYFRGYGATDLSDLIRKALGDAYSPTREVPVPSFFNRVIAGFRGLFS